MKRKHLALLLLGFLTGFSATAQNNSVKVAGAMKNVMKKGELQGTISLDSVAKKGVYGLGPVELLSGELLILDGEVFKSAVKNENSMEVEKTNAVKAPFFVYAEVEKWKSVSLPNSVNSLENLENFLNERTPDDAEAFPFRLKGKINSAKIHIVNLPQGQKVSSPKEAHEGLINYTLEDKEIEILGFFSRKHQAVFTHHNTYMHLHLITEDKKQMGHLDQVEFDANNLKLYLPE